MNSLFLRAAMLMFYLMASGLELSGKQKDTMDVVLYETSQDFRKRKSMDVNALLITDELSEHYFMVSKVIHKHNNNKVGDAKFIFAMKVGDSFYVNMGYNEDNYYENMFILLTRVGDKICVTTDVVVAGSSGAIIGILFGGVLGAVIGSAIDDGNADPYLFYIDLTEKEFRNLSRKRNESCLLKKLNRSGFKKLCKKYDVNTVVIEKPLIEEVYRTIDMINQS